VEQYANNPIEADHGRLKARLRPMRPEAPPFRADPGRRACLRPEPPLRPLLTRHRRPRPPPDPHSIRPAYAGHLTAGHGHQRVLSCALIGQCNTALLWSAGLSAGRGRPNGPGDRAGRGWRASRRSYRPDRLDGDTNDQKRPCRAHEYVLISAHPSENESRSDDEGSRTAAVSQPRPRRARRPT
jgi:hypothetical protein